MAAANVLKDHNAHPMWVKTENAREMYQLGIGAHHDQSKSGVVSKFSNMSVTLSLEVKRNPVSETRELVEEDWRKLGMTMSIYEPGLLIFPACLVCSQLLKNDQSCYILHTSRKSVVTRTTHQHISRHCAPLSMFLKWIASVRRHSKRFSQRNVRMADSHSEMLNMLLTASDLA